MITIEVLKESGLLSFIFFGTDKYEALDKLGINRKDILSVVVGDSLIRRHFFVYKEVSIKDAFHYACVKNRGITVFDGANVPDDNKKFSDLDCDDGEHFLLKVYTTSV